MVQAPDARQATQTPAEGRGGLQAAWRKTQAEVATHNNLVDASLRDGGKGLLPYRGRSFVTSTTVFLPENLSRMAHNLKVRREARIAVAEAGDEPLRLS